METQEELKEEGVGYVVMRNLFSRDTDYQLRVEKKTHSRSIRESADRLRLGKKIQEKQEFQKKMNPDSLTHPPEFTVKPRGQTVWEGKSVTLHCTVAGWPKPRVAWYKNNVLIDAKAHSKKYTTESNYNIHSLEIKKCDFSDTAEYRISALNVKGESSAFASIIVKSRLPMFPEYGVTFRTSIIDKFGVAFGREGETMSLGCTVVIYPTVKRYQPEVLWYRDGVLLTPSKWVHMHWSGDRATLTLVHLNKEDEGLYTLRINTKSGFDSHSAYVFVRDADVEAEGVPVAPLDVRCHDANKDYVVVTWTQPAVEGSSSILGYFIDRCEVGMQHWVQCNDTPVKYARFPVTGLIEGRSYIFRVRAINKAGVSHSSRVSDTVVAMDPSDRARLRAGPSAPWTGMIKFTEEDPTVGVVPGAPTDLAVTEATKSYVVLSWKPPVQRGHEGVMYYVEKCLVGTETWQRVNTGMPVKSPRFALFDLAEGKSYNFRVRSCNSAGVGEPSEETEATTVGDKLDLPSAPGSIVAIRNTSTSVVVTWGVSKEVRNLRYYIEVSVVGSNAWVPCNNKPVKGSRFVCHGLNTDDNCVFRVKAVNAAGYSTYSTESEACVVKPSIEVPSPPSAVTLLERVRDYMVVGWKAPAKTGGADIRGYYLDYRIVKGNVKSKWHEINLKAVTDTTYKVENLKENTFYEFQVRAVNQAGISKGSVPSAAFECKEWTVAVPGPARGLHVLEVRKDSMVLLWEPPTFNGRSPVTGYYVDIKEEKGRWRSIQERSTKNTYLKICGLKEGVSYQLRVHAKNIVGVGGPSQTLGPVVAQTRPGTNEIVVDVDDNGVISMIFECSEMAEGSQFVWSKNYKALTDTSRLTIETVGGKSRAIFNDPSLVDLGTYSCVVSNTDGVSASYTLTEEGKPLSLALCLIDLCLTVIPFTSEMAIELQEKGRVRFWTQVAKFTANCQVEYVFNDNIITQGKKYTMNFDKSTGIIEMFMDSLEVTDEGTFTFNLVDGKATGRTSLVLIGAGTVKIQKKSEFERAEWVRKQGMQILNKLNFKTILTPLNGPHFVEYLSFEVTPECDVYLKCKVGNIRPGTERVWIKDGIEIEEGDEDLSKKDAGVYEVELRDERGKDKTLLNLTDAGKTNSSSELKVESTEHGIILYTNVVYYTEELRVNWLQKDSKISHSDRVQCGVTGEQLWLKIKEPTEKDKGKYAIDIFDGSAGVKRVLELTGQGLHLPVLKIARVVGGLPDVVTIQEGKSLNLTGNVWGDPVPEVSWTKNDKELLPDEHYTLKFEHGKFASITIAAVTTTDSGKYALVVKNKYGKEAGKFTVSVYIPEDEAEKKD
uniref:Myomesin 1a (skelemin) n=1 Tax=Pygocentrus nattereri TaxID=42514 RepID=A0AAR2KZ49_PYGNA